jgi:hypothetical protein
VCGGAGSAGSGKGCCTAPGVSPSWLKDWHLYRLKMELAVSKTPPAVTTSPLFNRSRSSGSNVIHFAGKSDWPMMVRASLSWDRTGTGVLSMRFVINPFIWSCSTIVLCVSCQETRVSVNTECCMCTQALAVLSFLSSYTTC